MAHLVSRDYPLPGMADPDPAARFLVQHMITVAGPQPGLHVFVTHDSLVTTTAARLLGEPLGTDSWPWYLEGAFFWRDDGHLTAAYRNLSRRRTATNLVSLDERHVIDFARRETARTLGTRLNARFSLVGDAFKTLLTGRPPRSLKYRAASAGDRKTLLSVLSKRGAQRLDDRPFAEVFEIGGQIIELSHRLASETVEKRPVRFDEPLTTLAAEHRPTDRWRAITHVPPQSN